MPFKPGQSGNPAGRPKKGKSLTEILERHSRKRDVEFNGKKLSRREALAQQVWKMAISGDLAAARLIYERIDGKPTASVAMEHSGTITVSDETKKALADTFGDIGYDIADDGDESEGAE